MEFLKEIIEFFQDNRHLILNNKFEELYYIWSRERFPDLLTKILLSADINPLLYMTNINDYMYNGLPISNIIVPNNIIRIDSHAFLECQKLTYITLSNNLEIIKDYAFARCYNLKSIIIPKSLTYIGYSVFELTTDLIYEGSKEEWEQIIGNKFYIDHNISFLNK